jgi:hypothetical protein
MSIARPPRSWLLLLCLLPFPPWEVRFAAGWSSMSIEISSQMVSRIPLGRRRFVGSTLL